MKGKRLVSLLVCLCLVLICPTAAMHGPPYAASFQMGPYATVVYGGEHYDMTNMAAYNVLPIMGPLFEDNGWDFSEYQDAEWALRNDLHFLNGTIYFNKFPDGGGYDFLLSEEEFLFEYGRYYSFLTEFPLTCADGVFHDVSVYYPGKKPGDWEYHWYDDGIHCAVREGFFSGYDTGEIHYEQYPVRIFGLERTMTRAELLATVTRSTFPAVRSYDGVFTDVPDTAWYYAPIKRAYEAGLIEAGDGVFSPDAPATREFTALVLSKVMSGGERSSLPFTDADALSPECLAAAELLAGSGIIGGYEDGSFRPQATVTRAEYAVMLGRIISGGLYAAKTPTDAFAEEFVRRGKAEFGEAFDANTASSYRPDIPFPFYG